MDGKVVYQGKTKEGKEFEIRYPKKDDATTLCDYINALSQERTYIRFQGEIIKVEDEVEFINSQLEKINNNNGVLLLVVCEGEIIGCSGVEMKDKTESHEGVLGISIAKDFRGEGIGKKFMEAILKEAQDNIPQLRLITLGVFGDNDLALNMYPKFGFVEYGRLPGGSLHNGNYVDHICMYKKVR
ncbi:MAG: GNAT family protein [Candidatus Levybacteria bacterium]|nr:GNAT family protein [Candidatus Levybacteria bacterium]